MKKTSARKEKNKSLQTARVLRAQAAMEYLMTYGWALLAMVIVLAALIYLGVLKVPTPERCQLQTGLNCFSYRLDSDGTMTATISNVLQKEIAITHIRCTQEPRFNASTTRTGSFGLNRYQDITDITLPVGASGKINSFYCLTPTGARASSTTGKTYVGKLYVRYYFTSERTTPQAYRVNAGDINLKYQP